MSWGVPQFSGELSLDSTFQVPGVTFLGGSGDHGAPGIYPAYSPHVVAVGGTSLYNLDANGDYPGTGANGEVGWSLGSDPFAPGVAGGGGISRFEPEPSYQYSVQSTGQRTIPDISANADPLTGVPVYDPYDQGTAAPWAQYAGTSLASPLMAGMVALADQGRLLSGGQTFSSDQVLAALYSLHSSKPSDFHDIIHGYNGFNACPGYDLVTGLGTPSGSQLVPDLAYFGLSSRPILTSVAVTPSNPSVDEGFTQQLTATATFASGITQNVTGSVAWASATPSVATIDASGLATTHAAGTSVITASLDGVTSPGVTLTSSPLLSIVVTPSNPSVDEGFTQQLTATGTFAGGTTQNLASLVDWTPATPSVATIDASGLATTHAVGTSVITASLDGITSPGVALTSLPLVALAVAPNNPYVPVLVSVPFTVTGTYSDGSTHDLPTTSVAWASSQPAVATINSAGLATTHALGTSVITASLYGITSPGDVLTAIAPSFVVNTTDDELYTVGKTSLRQAILAANVYPGHTITFDPAVFKTPRTITLTLGQLELTETTGTETIKGPTAGVTVSGNNASRVFQIDAGVTASLSGLTISGGSAFNGAGLYNLGTVTLADCTVSGNSAAHRGGGLYTPYGASGSIALTSSTVSDNSAGGSGGGLDLRSLAMALTLTNCTVSGNSSGLNGGGMQVLGAATLTNCTVRGNSCGQVGGGLEFAYDTATLTNCTVSGNTASTEGGDLDFYYASATLTNCTISAGNAFSGGGVDCSNGSLAMSNCTVSGNSAYSGTGIDTGRFGTSTLTSSTVSGNSGFGGGVFQSFGTAVLTRCTLSGNTAAYGAGVCDLDGALTLTSCSVSGSSASANGGGVYSLGTATLTNCTISGNSASVNGGGVMSQYGTSRMTLTNCTVSGNSAANGGGVFTSGGATTTLTNCTVSGNSASVGGGISNQGTLLVASSTINKNQATSKGGGISTTGGTATITDSAINANKVESSATALGGGIDCENSLLSLTGCTVNANQASGATALGGGIYAQGSTVNVKNCTVNGNKAKGTVLGEGGGIYSKSSSLTLTASNVHGNKATTDYDDIFNGP